MHAQSKQRLVAIATVIMAVNLAGAQTTYFVNGACGDDAWAGTIQDCIALDGPKRTVQAAIDASVSGDTIRVADGVYTGAGNQDIDFGGRDITLISEGGPARCAIDLQANSRDPHRVFFFHKGETNSAVVEGFSIRGGYADHLMVGGSVGGAVYCVDSSPTFRNCDLTGNFAEHGCAIFLQASESVIEDCRFVGNSLGAGGGVYVTSESNPRIQDCVFSANEVVYQGGAIYIRSSRGTIINCLFAGNTAAWEGGGVHCDENADPRIINCTFADNIAGMEGGGLSVIGGSPIVTNCVFWGNSNGSIFSFSPFPPLDVTYCDVEGGYAGIGNISADPAFATVATGSWTADGVYDAVAGTTTFANQSAAFEINALAGMFINPNTLWAIQAPILSNTATTVTVLGDLTSRVSTGNVYIINDYRIRAGSPVIDAGDNTALPPGVTADLLGNPRFADDPGVINTGQPGGAGGSAIVDMGAIEFQDASCYADCDQSTGPGVLDMGDFLCFQAAFTSADPYACACDTSTGPAVCDIFDFLCFQTAFVAGCP